MVQPVDPQAQYTQDAFHTDVRRLIGYFEGQLDPLVDQSIDIAKTNGYAPFTTTIRAAWVQAILSVTESLGEYLHSLHHGSRGPLATFDYAADPRFTQMRKIAWQHRSLGITLPMYIGLFKHFRNLYIAALSGLNQDDFTTLLPREIIAYVRDFFDETELSIASDWHSSDENKRLRELQERARAAALDKDRYFAIFESLRNPAFLLDKTRTLMNANQAAAEMFLGDAQAGEIIYLRSMRQRKILLQTTIQQIMDALTNADQTIWLETLQGMRCFDVRTRALHDAVENIPLGHVVLLNDVTQHRKAAEEAEQSERGMSRFLAAMSHEIRTPLHSVLGATEMLRISNPQTAESDFLDLIDIAGQNLLQTLNNVLDYSKLENETPSPRPTNVNLTSEMAAFARVATLGQKTHGLKNRTAELQVDVAQDLDPYIHIDWAMTRQVLSNLVSNAIRVTDENSVKVRISETSQAMLRFEVQDHGPGIPPEYAEALFCPFEKITARDTGSGGAGLGLAISHYLVRAMQGQIGYENGPEGATVWFEIPYQIGVKPTRADRHAHHRRTAVQETPTCLLVDDDPIGNTVTKSQLESLGFHVTCACSLAEAKAAIKNARYDVFVVDYLLPDGEGPSLIRTLRGQEGPKASDPLCIALTANPEALESNAETRDLFDHILAKPIGQRNLSKALKLPDDVSTPLAKNSSDPVALGLERLSDETIRAMSEAFETEWNHFLNVIQGPYQISDIMHLSHRLAGSTAILGLRELEVQMRELERACKSGQSHGKIHALLAQIDRDLCVNASWRRLSKLVEQSA